MNNNYPYLTNKRNLKSKIINIVHHLFKTNIIFSLQSYYLHFSHVFNTESCHITNIF